MVDSWCLDKRIKRSWFILLNTTLCKLKASCRYDNRYLMSHKALYSLLLSDLESYLDSAHAVSMTSPPHPLVDSGGYVLITVKPLYMMRLELGWQTVIALCCCKHNISVRCLTKVWYTSCSCQHTALILPVPSVDYRFEFLSIHDKSRSVQFWTLIVQEATICSCGFFFLHCFSKLWNRMIHILWISESQLRQPPCGTNGRSPTKNYGFCWWLWLLHLPSLRKSISQAGLTG